MEPQAAEEVSSRRIWAAIIVATVVEVIAYGFLMLAWFAIVAEDSGFAAENDISGSAGPPFALGLILVPFVFIALAFISKRERAPIATLKAMGFWLLIVLPLGLVLHLSIALAAAFGAGGVATLRRRPGYRLSYRVWAVVITAAYVTLLLFIAPPGAFLTAAVLPLPALGIADNLAVRWSTASEEDGDEA